MFELVYPLESAPRLPRRRVSLEAPTAAPASEMLPVVDENGLIKGQASREDCHRLKLLHPVVHLHIIDHFENIYLQKRSAQKELYPKKWDFAVGGHIIYGELCEEALYRETREEIGLKEFNPIYLETYICEVESVYELVNVYAAVGHFDNLTTNKEEIEEGRWWDIPEAEAKFGRNIFTPVFEREFKQIKKQLLSLL